mgnify:CR=1 FL=1
MRYHYPEYAVRLTPELLAQCRELAQRLLEDVGLRVRSQGFVRALRTQSGVTVDGDRVRLSHALTDKFLDAYAETNRKALLAKRPRQGPGDAWSLRTNGYSIMVIDVETDQVRPATRQDLRDLIRLVRSFGMGGSYPCTPQDVPPLMRALECFRICWQESDNIKPFDYMDIRQTPYLLEMHRVMGKPFVINVNIPHAMTISEHDIDIFLKYYPVWKRNHAEIGFYSICDYPMLGVCKPITATGCLASYLAQSFGAYMLFKLFDPEVEMLPRLSAGMPVDLRTMCWAYGSPRRHLYDYLNSQALPALCGLTPFDYLPESGSLDTGSCAVDARAGMEKMASALVAAMQGARVFCGAGNLAVDDLFSGVQLVIDVEIFEYVKEVVRSFSPHPDIVTLDGLYDVLRDTALGAEEFYSHPDTASKVRSLLPVSPRRPHEKLRSWLEHGQNMKDRAREECLERIRNQPPYTLDEHKRRELDNICARAEKELAGQEAGAV